jgi:uncharacterized alkaline shock family protein YloU
MSNTTSTTSTTSQGSQSSSSLETGGSALVTDHGKTSIADSVVAKIAGIAAREISGVHNMGSGAARTVGAIKDRFGSASKSSVTQGVSVEVGERQAAVDLDLVVEYGVAIVDLSRAVRDNVTRSIERMTGLEVTEVNVFVDDIHIASEDDKEAPPAPERVQ